MQKVYLAGQPNEYEDNWKEKFKRLSEFEFYDWETDSDQSSPDTFFPDDLRAVEKCDILVANPGLASSESTWIEIGYFLRQVTKQPGERSKKLIIIWRPERNPRWSIEFVKMAGTVVATIDEAITELTKLRAD